MGLTTPLSRWLRGVYLFVLVRGTRAWPPTGLIPWFSKIEGNTYATLLHHPFLFKGKPTQCSIGSKKDLWRHCRGVYAKVNIPNLMDYGTRSGKSISLGMPMAPQDNSRTTKSLSLGMPRKASPLSSSFIGNFTWSYIFIRQMICVLLGASCRIWVFAF